MQLVKTPITRDKVKFKVSDIKSQDLTQKNFVLECQFTY